MIEVGDTIRYKDRDHCVVSARVVRIDAAQQRILVVYGNDIHEWIYANDLVFSPGTHVMIDTRFAVVRDQDRDGDVVITVDGKSERWYRSRLVKADAC